MDVLAERLSLKDLNDVFPAEWISSSEMTVTHGKSLLLYFVTLWLDQVLVSHENTTEAAAVLCSEREQSG